MRGCPATELRERIYLEELRSRPENTVIAVDCYYLRQLWENTEYGYLQSYIDFQDLLGCVTKNFDTDLAWQQIEYELSHYMDEHMVLIIDTSIRRFIQDIRHTRLWEFRSPRVSGFEMKAHVGDIYFFEAISND